MSKPFGKFDSIESFLTSYTAQRNRDFNLSLEGLEMDAQLEAVRRRRERDVVEVQSSLRVREDDDTSGGNHYHLLINVTEVVETDDDVDADVQACKDEQRDVFVAIRYGDSMGIQEPIEGLDPGAQLHMRGEWIPADKAYSHGGEKRSVLHFTHRPLGFICVSEKCYS